MSSGIPPYATPGPIPPDQHIDGLKGMEMERGVKRKIAGWTAPPDSFAPASLVPPTTTMSAGDSQGTTPSVFLNSFIAKQEPPPFQNLQQPAEPSPIKPNPLRTASPVPAQEPVQPHPARMGTRLPGSGDLLNTGARTVTWPIISGVRVGQVMQNETGNADGMETHEGREEVREEECYSWGDLPMNKQGFRYIPCGPSPVPSPSATHPFYRRVPALHAPFGKMEPDSEAEASTKSVVKIEASTANEIGTSIPKASPPSIETPSPVHLDWLDRSTYLKISPSALTCTAEKGFRSVRGNVPVRSGAWYFECLILRGGGDGAAATDPSGRARNGLTSRRFGGALPAGESTGKAGPDGAHVRLGWARREAPVNGPCGLDAYSYGVRDTTGEAVTLSRPKGYADGGFGTGDVVGCLIQLPQRRDGAEEATIKRKRIPIRYKGQLYFEMMEYTVAKEMEALVARDGRPVPVPEVVEQAPPSPQKSKAKRQAGKAVRKKPGKRDEPVEEDVQPRARALPRLSESKIAFFLNGKPMAPDPAFTDIFDFLPLRQTEAEVAAKAAMVRKLGPLEASLRDRENECDDGTLGYYPFVSCFGGGKVQLHAGPQWMAPPDPTTWNLGTEVVDGAARPVAPRPLSERWHEFCAEETTYDRADEDELTRLLRQEHAAETAKKRVKGTRGKQSVGKRASIAAAIQASTPSRASSTVPSVSGAPTPMPYQPSAYLATMIQDRGTPGGTPAPDTPVQAEFPEVQVESHQPDIHLTEMPHQPIAGSPSAPPISTVIPAPPQPYPIYPTARATSPSATSEDAIGEDDWSTAVSERMVGDDAPELPYGMEVTPSLAEGSGQIQQPGMRLE